MLIPLTLSITQGILWGFILHALLYAVVAGARVSPTLWILAAFRSDCSILESPMMTDVSGNDPAVLWRMTRGALDRPRHDLSGAVGDTVTWFFDGVMDRAENYETDGAGPGARRGNSRNPAPRWVEGTTVHLGVLFPVRVPFGATSRRSAFSPLAVLRRVERRRGHERKNGVGAAAILSTCLSIARLAQNRRRPCRPRPGRRRRAGRRPVDDDDRYGGCRGDGEQCIELAEAGSEMVRVTVNLPEAAAAVPEIKQRMLDAGCTAPLIGDFHYNGHLLLTRFPACAAGARQIPDQSRQRRHRPRRDEQFATICKVAIDHDKPVRIGVNGGSLNQELVVAKMQENTDRNLGGPSEEILNECMVISAIESTELALETGLRKDQIIISCKVSRPRDLIAIYRDLARKTDQPLHLGLTEAGMGTKGLIWSASAMGSCSERGHRRHRSACR